MTGEKRELPHNTTSVTRGYGPPVSRWIVSIAGMWSIRQSVQNGQFYVLLAINEGAR